MKRLLALFLLLPSLAFAAGDIWITPDDVTVPASGGCDKYLLTGTDHSVQIVECDVNETFSVTILGDDDMPDTLAHLTFWEASTTGGERGCFTFRMAAFRYGEGGNTKTASMGSFSSGQIVDIDTSFAYQLGRKTLSKAIYDALLGAFCSGDAACDDTVYNVLEFKRVVCGSGVEIDGKLIFLGDHITW